VWFLVAAFCLPAATLAAQAGRPFQEVMKAWKTCFVKLKQQLIRDFFRQESDPKSFKVLAQLRLRIIPQGACLGHQIALSNL